MTSADGLADRVGMALGVRAVGSAPLAGGSTGPVVRIDLADGSRVVAKGYAGLGAPPASEAAQLDRLRRTGAFPVPAVHLVRTDLLVLDWVETDPPAPWPARTAAEVGARLAVLHRSTGPACGFDDQTWIGRVAQPNPWTRRWPNFFASQRLNPIIRACRAAGRLPDTLAEPLAALARAPERWLSDPAAPALLHGDLWPGNVLIRDGRVVGLIDPALQYGHPALDLATPGAYGAVDPAFADGYRAEAGTWPMSETEGNAHRLWPLLVNLLYWDPGYADAAARVLAALPDLSVPHPC